MYNNVNANIDTVILNRYWSSKDRFVRMGFDDELFNNFSLMILSNLCNNGSLQRDDNPTHLETLAGHGFIYVHSASKRHYNILWEPLLHFLYGG